MVIPLLESDLEGEYVNKDNDVYTLLKAGFDTFYREIVLITSKGCNCSELLVPIYHCKQLFTMIGITAILFKTIVFEPLSIAGKNSRGHKKIKRMGLRESHSYDVNREISLIIEHG